MFNITNVTPASTFQYVNADGDAKSIAAGATVAVTTITPSIKKLITALVVTQSAFVGDTEALLTDETPFDLDSVVRVSKTLTGVVEIPDMNLLPVGPARALKKTAAICRDYGVAQNATSTYTHFLTRSAPAHFDAVQVTLHGDTGGANAFKASVAVSAKFNNGFTPVNSADVVQSFIPLTWGTTNRANVRNPGGGAATATVAVAGSTATFDLIEGDVPSDILSISSLSRADGGALPLLMLRLYGINAPACSSTESRSDAANPWSAVLPDHFSGYEANDKTADSAYAGPPAKGWLPNVSVTFFLRGVAINVVAVAGDSVDQGYVDPTAVPQFGGNINGWCRRLCAQLNAAGNPTQYISLAHAGQRSRMFHERALNFIYSGRLTHIFVKPWSVNETAQGVASVPGAIKRTNQIIQACIENNVVPIVIRPWGGQGNGTAMMVLIDAYVDTLVESGVRVFNARSVADDSNGYLKSEYRTKTAGGADVDATHPNDAGHQAIADLALANRTSFLL